MKKIVALLTVAVMMFSLVSVVSAANYEYDIASNSGAVDFAAAGYTGKVFQMTNYGQTVNLGKIDLTKYSKVIISYGADGGATFDGKDYVALASAAVQADNGSAADGAKVYAKCVLESNGTGWLAGQRTVEAAISVADFTADSDVILAINIDQGPDGKADGIAIDEITFVEGTPATTPGDGQGSTDDKNPATADTAVVVIAAVAAFAFAGVVVSKKVKA